MHSKITVLILALFFSLSSAKAEQGSGFVIFPSVGWQQQNGYLAGDQNIFGMDIRAGYKIPSGFYFGLIYSNYSSSGTNSVSQSRLGNTVGYFLDIFTFAASFFLVASSTETTPAASVLRTEGTGFQFDLAVTFPIASFFNFGPVLSFKSITYNKRQDNGVTLSSTAQSQSTLEPSLGFLFTF
ncbi:MAG: hypothetical protein IPM57_11655 [Oligoflexia bacterium]|nr:hypothetical protein [Oligoflexia bacterium]